MDRNLIADIKFVLVFAVHLGFFAFIAWQMVKIGASYINQGISGRATGETSIGKFALENLTPGTWCVVAAVIVMAIAGYTRPRQGPDGSIVYIPNSLDQSRLAVASILDENRVRRIVAEGVSEAINRKFLEINTTTLPNAIKTSFNNAFNNSYLVVECISQENSNDMFADDKKSLVKMNQDCFPATSPFIIKWTNEKSAIERFRALESEIRRANKLPKSN